MCRLWRTSNQRIVPSDKIHPRETTPGDGWKSEALSPTRSKHQRITFTKNGAAGTPNPSRLSPEWRSAQSSRGHKRQQECLQTDTIIAPICSGYKNYLCKICALERSILKN